MLETLRLHATFRYSIYGGKKRTHIEADTRTIRHVVSYLCTNKLGRPFKCIEVLLNGRGDPWHSREQYQRMSDYSRPTMLFTCVINENGDINIEDNRSYLNSSVWAHYLDDESGGPPGRTYPEDLESWIEDGDIADQIMAGKEGKESYDDTASLFRYFDELE